MSVIEQRGNGVRGLDLDLTRSLILTCVEEHNLAESIARDYMRKHPEACRRFLSMFPAGDQEGRQLELEPEPEPDASIAWREQFFRSLEETPEFLYKDFGLPEKNSGYGRNIVLPKDFLSFIRHMMRNGISRMEIQRTIGFSRGIRLDPDALTRMSMILIPLATCLYIPCTWRFFDGGKAGIAETLVEILSNLQESVDRTRDLAGGAPITILTPPLLEQDSEFRTARLRWKGPTRFPDTVVRGANDRELLLEVLIWLQDRWLKSGDYDRQMDRFISDAHTHATAALGSRTPVPGSYDARRWLSNFTGIPDVRNKAAFNRVRLYLAAALRQPDLPDDLKSRIRTCFPESVLARL